MCNRHNYSRWATLYAVDMCKSLPKSIEDEFNDGQFPVRFTSGKFNGVWSDLAVEMSVIKDTKAKTTGIIGFALKESAVLRWTVTRHILGGYASEMRRRSGILSPISEIHKQQGRSMVVRDEADVSKIMSHLHIDMTDPFNLDLNNSDQVINISSGLAATSQVSKSLLNAFQDGKELMKNFIAERLEPLSQSSKSFHGPIKKSSLLTFKEMQKSTRVTIGNKKKNVAVSSEVVYQRALALAKVRPDVNLSTVLSHPIGSVPSSLFMEDGTRRKTTKSDLLHELEKTADSSVKELPESLPSMPTAYIVDAMALLQRMNTKHMKTFNDVGLSFMNSIAKLFSISTEIHVVFDRYDDPNSTKYEERQKRQTSSGHRYVITGNRPLPDWKHIMELDLNKANLIYFLSAYLETQRHVIAEGKKLYLAGCYIDGLTTKCLTTKLAAEEEGFSTNQKEADTRMILHAVNFNEYMSAMTTKGRIFIQTPGKMSLSFTIRIIQHAWGVL